MRLTHNSDPEWLMKYAAEMPRTYKVSDDRYPWLVKQIERLNKMIDSINKRGAEFGAGPMPPIKINIIKRDIQIPDKNVENKIHIGKEIQVVGEAPRIKGWIFVATIMPLVDDEGKQANVIKSVPGAGPVPEKYRTSMPKCDYCKQTRRRNETFVLLNPATKEYKEIGRNCLAKFLNTTSPEGVANLAEAYAGMMETLDGFDKEFMGGEFEGGGGERGVPIGSFVATVVAIQRAAGWKSRSKAREEGREDTATADLAWNYMDPKSKSYVEKIVGNPIESRPEDVEVAKRAIQWARDLRKRAPESLNDYLGSLTAATSIGYVPRKLIGYVASVVSAHQRSEQNKGFFKGKVQKRDVTEQGTTAWLLKDEKGKDIVWYDSQHDPQIEAALNKAISDQSDVFFKGSFERTDSYSGQGMTQAIVEKFLTPEEYAQENKEALEKERLAQEKLKDAPQLVPQGKVKMTLTVDKVKYIESQYGSKAKYEMTDEFGRKFFWMTSSSQELEEGKTYVANVTVGWEKLPGQNKPLLDAEGKRSLAKDKFSGAIRLESVKPISVGGQAMITRNDINAVNKQIGQIRKQVEDLNNQISPLSQKRYELLSGAGAPTSTDSDDMGELAKAKMVVQREIERAKSSPQDQEFEANFEGASHYLGYQFGGLKQRPITPEELLKETEALFAKNQAVIDEIKSHVPEMETMFAEFVALQQKNDWRLSGQKSQQMYEVMKALENKYSRYGDEGQKGVVINWPYFRNPNYMGVKEVQHLVEFFKNPSFNAERLNTAKTKATEAIQSGVPFDVNAFYPPDGIELRKKDPLYPSRFIEAAQGVLARISEAETNIPVINKQIIPLQERVKALNAQETELRHKAIEMDESRRRGRPRTAAWLSSIIKK